MSLFSKNRHRIEYVGLPGGGKTYLARKDAERTGSTFVTIQNRRERYMLGSLFIIVCPLKSVLFLWVTFIESNNQGVRLLFHKLFFLCYSSFAREAKAMFVEKPIIDEGLFQLLCCSIYERPIDIQELSKFLRVLKPDHYSIVFVTAAKDVRESRMRDRGRFPRQRILGEGARARFYGAIENNEVTFINFFKEYYSYKPIAN